MHVELYEFASYVKGRTLVEGDREYGTEEEIWAKVGRGNRGLEEITF